MPTLKIRANQFDNCRVCLLSKATCSSHNGERKRPTRKFSLITTDILDPKADDIIEGNRYIVAFTCAYTDYTYLRTISSRDHVAVEWAKYHKLLQNKFPEYPVTEIRTDGALEFVAGDFRQYCEANSIVVDDGHPYSSELNGIAERKNKTILMLIRAMLLDAELPPNHWVLTLPHIEQIINSNVSKGNRSAYSTPYEAVFLEKPDVKNFVVFGSHAVAQIPQERCERIAARNEDGSVKLGLQGVDVIVVAQKSTGYELINPIDGSKPSSGDVRIIESENLESLKRILSKSLSLQPDMKKKNAPQQKKRKNRGRTNESNPNKGLGVCTGPNDSAPIRSTLDKSRILLSQFRLNQLRINPLRIHPAHQNLLKKNDIYFV